MNLIEQLGGYEKAKEVQEQRALDGLLHDYDWDLHSELLEYRRQHNIYEVEDLVCVKFTNKLLRIYHIYQSTDNEDGYYDGSEEVGLECISTNYSTHTYLSDIRHATDAEIQAGRRLS